MNYPKLRKLICAFFSATTLILYAAFEKKSNSQILQDFPFNFVKSLASRCNVYRLGNQELKAGKMHDGTYPIQNVLLINNSSKVEIEAYMSYLKFDFKFATQW